MSKELGTAVIEATLAAALVTGWCIGINPLKELLLPGVVLLAYLRLVRIHALLAGHRS